jgi:hypothetical protein
MFDWLTWVVEHIAFVAIVGTVLIAVLIFAGIGAIGLIAKQREGGGRRAANTYANIRAGSFWTLLTLLVGVVLSGAVGIVVWRVIFDSTGYIFNKPFLSVVLSRHAMGLIAAGFAAYGVFQIGELVPIDPGFKAYLRFLKIPFGNLGAGLAWIPRWFMDYKIVNSQARENKSETAREYLTKNGVEIFVASGVSYLVNNPLLAQGIAPGGDIEAYINAQREAAVRRFIGTQQLDMSLAFKEGPTAPEQLDIFNQLVQIKGDVSANGPQEVRDSMNQEISAYGMNVTQVQFTEVLFKDTLEAKIALAFEEIAEAPGLIKDQINKAAQVKVLIDRTLDAVGLKLADLKPEVRLSLIQRGQAYVLASEGQGGYNYNDFGGSPPPGVLFTVPPTQTPPRS